MHLRFSCRIFLFLSIVNTLIAGNIAFGSLHYSKRKSFLFIASTNCTLTTWFHVLNVFIKMIIIVINGKLNLSTNCADSIYLYIKFNVVVFLLYFFLRFFCIFFALKMWYYHLPQFLFFFNFLHYLFYIKNVHWLYGLVSVLQSVGNK